MTTATRLICLSLLAAAASTAGCGKEPASGPGPTMKELLGPWSGSMTHEGESQPLALELEPAEEGQVSLRLTVPAMNLARQPVGMLKPELLGNTLTLGPFTFTYDGENQTLSGTMPAAFVPVYEIRVVLRRVESVEAPSRPQPTAPLAEPVVETPIERLPPTDPKSRFDSFGSDVTVAEGRLFLGTFDGRVLTLDPANGQSLWEFSADGSVLAAPAVSSARVCFGSFDGHVRALDAATGKLLWKTDTKGAILSTPAVAGELLVVGNRSYDLLGLDATTGEVAWKQYIWFSWVESSATVRDGIVYIGSSDAAAAFTFDARTGERLWKADVYGWAWGQPAVTNDRVFVGTAALRDYQNDVHRGGVVALDRATGQAVWRYALEPPAEGAWGFPGSPAVGAGHVFVTGLDGRVLAFAQ